MPKYEFTITVVGIGDTEEDAWEDCWEQFGERAQQNDYDSVELGEGVNDG